MEFQPRLKPRQFGERIGPISALWWPSALVTVFCFYSGCYTQLHFVYRISFTEICIVTKSSSDLYAHYNLRSTIQEVVEGNYCENLKNDWQWKKINKKATCRTWVKRLYFKEIRFLAKGTKVFGSAEHISKMRGDWQRYLESVCQGSFWLILCKWMPIV